MLPSRSPAFPARLGDHSADRRMVMLSAMALVVGSGAALGAWVLLRLIALCTNVFWFGRLSVAEVEIADASVGLLALVLPVIGALIIGLMARFGSDKIRGHGIPEAMEAILYGESRLSPKVAVLKPLSSAISIGSGGPFGAEGPIIMTGGAIGSLFAQCFHLSAAERKTLLVAGAAGGMTAIFGTPLAAILLAVEVLLFEWKPRSLLPVIVAVLVSLAWRATWIGVGPLFPTTASLPDSPWTLPGAAALGLLVGLLSVVLTAALYAIEDAFHRLPVHWMWWPALGAVAVGLGGLIDPRVLGAGYANIHMMLAGTSTTDAILLLLVVKAAVWLLALGSGTSGGVLAPLLILGGALGWLSGRMLPGSEGFWAMIGMAGIMSSGMRAPLTGILFAAEATGRFDALAVMLACSAAAFGVSVLLSHRSILTEKIARRGRHLLQEYGVDPLDLLQAQAVMTPGPETLPGTMTTSAAVEFFARDARHRSYPVVDEAGRLLGLASRTDALGWRQGVGDPGATLVETLSDRAYPVVHPDATCSAVADLAVQSGVGRIPVVSPTDGRVLGVITRQDLLRARLDSRRQDSHRSRTRLLRAFPGPSSRDGAVPS
ncbi:chloride channel protein [Rubellimicrobium arenae]|uniref:chloride channel protein n=1 Tax=Rubellimicrobium arenae TaxID=2817372 RepID=UPI001B313786|nr:chloride channel protein [Rubellimicrobium arenae]